MKIQLEISQLASLLECAEQMKRHDDSLSSTIEIEVLEECKTHTGGDKIIAELKSSYSECNGVYLSSMLYL